MIVEKIIVWIEDDPPDPVLVDEQIEVVTGWN